MAIPFSIKNYRPDIDGLRAIAVLSVVIFHFFPAFFPAGFIGVDIFFVISGYLISKHIFEDNQKNQFSFLQFYIRRIKRIFPALLTVLIFCFLIGWFTLWPLEYQLLNKHILGGIGSISNILLWQEIGYFDTAADSKILLHLWSLGIEEQFYLVAPLLFYILFKLKSSVRAIGIWLISLFALSFLINLFFISKNPSTVFYLPFFRGWELLMGSLLAYGHVFLCSKEKVSSALNTAFSIIGILCLFVGFFLLNKTQPFPGWRALLPTCGAIFLIAAGERAFINRVFLSHPIFVAIGLISFSLYLWHWPFFVFAKLLSSGAPLLSTLFIALILSFVFSGLSFYFVERPFRQTNKKWPFYLILCCSTLLFSISLNAYYREGLPFREKYISSVKFSKLSTVQKSCSDKFSHSINCFSSQGIEISPEIVLLGDSHAEHFFKAFQTISGSKNTVVLDKYGCIPLIDMERIDIKNCVVSFKDRLQWVSSKKSTIKTVVLSARWPVYFHQKGFGIETDAYQVTYKGQYLTESNRVLFLQKALEETLSFLLKNHKKIIFIHSVPELGFHIRECLPRKLALPSLVERTTCTVDLSKTYERVNGYRAAFEPILKKYPQIQVIDPFNYFCDSKVCYARKGNSFFYKDDDHLSLEGSTEFGIYLRKNNSL